MVFRKTIFIWKCGTQYEPFMVYMRGVNKKLIIKNYDGLFPLPDVFTPSGTVGISREGNPNDRSVSCEFCSIVIKLCL